MLNLIGEGVTKGAEKALRKAVSETAEDAGEKAISKTALKAVAKATDNVGDVARKSSLLSSLLSPEQEKYFAKSVVRDADNNLKHLYHGSTGGKFDVFDMSKTNPESDWGRGFYLSDNLDDVNENYRYGGADLESKLERMAENISADTNVDYDDAMRQARNELYKEPYLIDAYVNFENPAIVGKTNLLDGGEYPVKALGDYDNIEDYYGDLLYDLADNAVFDTNIDYSEYRDQILGILADAYYNGGIGMQELADELGKLGIVDTDYNYVSNDVARSIIENLGFDGIIDPTVSKKFYNMGIPSGTSHYIAFNPNQVKKVANRKPTINPNMNYALALLLGGGALLNNNKKEG